jgi:hypothetical protein
MFNEDHIYYAYLRFGEVPFSAADLWQEIDPDISFNEVFLIERELDRFVTAGWLVFVASEPACLYRVQAGVAKTFAEKTAVVRARPACGFDNDPAATYREAQALLQRIADAGAPDALDPRLAGDFEDAEQFAARSTMVIIAGGGGLVTPAVAALALGALLEAAEQNDDDSTFIHLLVVAGVLLAGYNLTQQMQQCIAIDHNANMPSYGHSQ